MNKEKAKELERLIIQTLDRSCDPSRFFDGLQTVAGSRVHGEDAASGLTALFAALEREEQSVFREVQETLETIEKALREEGGDQ